jgi:hypothetical protein
MKACDGHDATIRCDGSGASDATSESTLPAAEIMVKKTISAWGQIWMVCTVLAALVCLISSLYPPYQHEKTFGTFLFVDIGFVLQYRQFPRSLGNPSLSRIRKTMIRINWYLLAGFALLLIGSHIFGS